ncbi:MAG TPA: hypothetical protein PKC98_14550 [Candidatus Melainabacteria bacterium]|nr:hypothetical protein [Candidatus Melainabacteria bacterium]
MSRFDGSREKKQNARDSASFRGRRHPFMERGVDWKAIEKTRYGGIEGGLDTNLDPLAEVAREVDFEITGMDTKQDRIEKCVAAVKQLPTNPDMWYRIRDYLIEVYQEVGPKKKEAKAALFRFVATVNKRLGTAGEIKIDSLIGLLARNVAQAEKVSKPELSVYVTIRYPGGEMGPIGIAFEKGGSK